MTRWTSLFFDIRTLAALGLASLGGLAAAALRLDPRRSEALAVVAVVAALALLVALLTAAVRFVRRRRERAAGAGDAVPASPEPTPSARDAARAGREQLRRQVREAIRTITTSRLGERTGRAALHELPWTLLIGSPGSGKTSAVLRSGLAFPLAGLAERDAGHGGAPAPTADCAWRFTGDGVLIDTAGRYAVDDAHRDAWLALLALLKKHRPKAPLDAIVVTASLAELHDATPDATARLAKSLRRRVQELAETLEVVAPVYLLFTKADLIAGFTDFFAEQDPAERAAAWGATLPYEPTPTTPEAEPGARFDRHFDLLHDGLRDLALARMTRRGGRPLPPAVLAFPLEFAGLKPALQAFVTTLFEDNPYQLRPVFRGFYFTSALQDAEAPREARNGIAERFGVVPGTAGASPAAAPNPKGRFLHDVFARVIFADRHLVRQRAGRRKERLRTLGFVAGTAVLAVLLACWSASYLGNRQLAAGVRADLDKAVRLQKDRVDLASRLEALELLQNRIEELEAWRRQRPLAVGFGLYQGETIERKLRQAYFEGVRRVMLEPVAHALEDFLGEVNRRSAELRPVGVAAEAPAPTAAPRPATASRYAEASPTDVEDAYKALKTYLMMAERQRLEAGHLTDQVTRFWRGWLEAHRGTLPRERLMKSAERLISFSMANLQDPAFPVIDDNFGLVDQTRETLRRVVQGTPAIERVYADIKARASTRFASVTVAGVVGEKGAAAVAGSEVVPGTFTREAWSGYVDRAIREAASNELQTSDWVLKTSTRDDLSLQGSPEQIRKHLTDRYKAEYVAAWQRFLAGVAVAEFGSVDAAVERMDVLGDPLDSPLRKLVATSHRQTSWDAPAARGARPTAGDDAGALGWFRRTVLRESTHPSEANPSPAQGEPAGAVAREFAAVERLVVARDGGTTLLDAYLQSLARIRSRFHQARHQGDAGPVARDWLAKTFDAAGGSEFADALRLVDEQLLVGTNDAARGMLKPLLLQPLTRSFAVLIAPAEVEVNRLWTAQVLQPFEQNLAAKYPFDPASKVEAAPAEIARVFGPGGSIARFATDALGPLVTRRGDSVTPRLWAQSGLRLKAPFVEGLPAWVGVLDGAAGQRGGADGTAASSFQLLPESSAGFVQVRVEIDGQTLASRAGAADWTTFVWPNAGGSPGARIVGTTADGRTVEVFSAPGGFGFERLVEAARVRRLENGERELSWGEGAETVSLRYRAITAPGPTRPAGATARAGLRGLRLPDAVAGVDVAAPAPASNEVARVASGGER